MPVKPNMRQVPELYFNQTPQCERSFQVLTIFSVISKPLMDCYIRLASQRNAFCEQHLISTLAFNKNSMVYQWVPRVHLQ
jgi:hypothetical protein